MRHPKYGKFYRVQMPQMMNGWNTIVGLYDPPQDIDLYVGVLNEVHMQGAQRQDRLLISTDMKTQ